MTDDMNGTPEKWEAGDIIDELKKTLPVPGQQPEIQGVCARHPVLEAKSDMHTRAEIWIIRHLAILTPKSHAGSGNENDPALSWDGTKRVLKVHGTTALLILAVIVHIIYSEHKRVDPQGVKQADSSLRTFIRQEVVQAVKGAMQEGKE